MNRSGGASTRVSGHTLREEGRQRWHRDGSECSLMDSLYCSLVHYGICSCGEIAPLLPSMHGVRRWHREHKNTIRAAS